MANESKFSRSWRNNYVVIIQKKARYATTAAVGCEEGKDSTEIDTTKKDLFVALKLFFIRNLVVGGKCDARVR